MCAFLASGNDLRENVCTNVFAGVSSFASHAGGAGERTVTLDHVFDACVEGGGGGYETDF